MKLRILDDGDLVANVDAAADIDVAAALSKMGPFDAIGCRVVHGGTRFTKPVVVSEDVLEDIRDLTNLAPLHQPASAAAIETLRKAWPDVPIVACFDTAFHTTLPPASSTYALPKAWRTKWPLRRFGFHGLSHRYLSRRMAELMGTTAEELRIVTCHLGAGASLCAVEQGRSVDTTMGFTPLEGLVMATRSGSIDPGLVLWLMQDGGLSADEVNNGLEHLSGINGLTGTSDMAKVIEDATQNNSDAALAIDIYIHHLQASIAAMAATMGGVDGVIFGGGIGEHASVIRERAANGLAFLGLTIDQRANDGCDGRDMLISTANANVTIGVAETREDIEIARATCALLSS